MSAERSHMAVAMAMRTILNLWKNVERNAKFH
ncbi:CG43165 [Drosophila busckii]|uniref:CG43165 n=1 Tax=Drosophila busckii TaxID=30019 RepID=A0A0M3QUW8_DROBS|nr:CG43165 [Drosophila busckii]